MSIDPSDMNAGARPGAYRPRLRSVEADLRAERRLAAAIDDLCREDDMRLDDRTRAALSESLGAMVSAVEGEVRLHAAKLLATRGEAQLAELLGTARLTANTRLIDTRMADDTAFMREMLARVRLDFMARAIPTSAPDIYGGASLLPRLINDPDGVVAAAAMAVLAGESRRRSIGERDGSVRTDLPAELHHRLTWWVAAALSEVTSPQAGVEQPLIDLALSDAALRSLAGHDEGERLEAAAMRLASALDPGASDLGTMLMLALVDRRIVLFTAMIAHGLRVSYDLARDLVLDAEADTLWLALRALDCDRSTIARIGFALCEADPARDVEQFADRIDAIAATAVDQARAILAPLRLHPDFRAAMLALAKAGRG